MSQHRKHRGYASQRIVADYLREHGFGFAESTGAGRSGTDVTGTPGIDWEVKARRSLNLVALIDQMLDRGDDDLHVAVVRPDGKGPATIQDGEQNESCARSTNSPRGQRGGSCTDGPGVCARCRD